MKKKVFIAGADDLGRELYGWITSEPAGSRFDVAGFVDDREVDLTPFGISLPVYRSGEWAERFPGAAFLPAVFLPATRRAMVKKLLDRGATPESYVHSSVLVANGAQIGRGCILLPNSIISPYAVIGAFVLANARCDIGHDAVIGDYTTLLGSDTVNGLVSIGPDTLIGSSAVIHPKVNIGEGAKIGIGSVVVGNVEPHTTVFGNPARKLA